LDELYYLYLICPFLSRITFLHRVDISNPFTMSIPKDTTTDVAIERQAAEQLHVDIIPGTEVMTDVGNSHLAKAGGNGSV
jgi:hypothetical protein